MSSWHLLSLCGNWGLLGLSLACLPVSCRDARVVNRLVVCHGIVICTRSLLWLLKFVAVFLFLLSFAKRIAGSAPAILWLDEAEQAAKLFLFCFWFFEKGVMATRK